MPPLAFALPPAFALAFLPGLPIAPAFAFPPVLLLALAFAFPPGFALPFPPALPLLLPPALLHSGELPGFGGGVGVAAGGGVAAA